MMEAMLREEDWLVYLYIIKIDSKNHSPKIIGGSDFKI